MPQDEVQRLEATIKELKAQQEVDRQELQAARAEIQAVQAAATEAMVATRLELGSSKTSFLARNWAPLLVAGLMAPLIVALMVMLDRATTRAAACQAQQSRPTADPPPRVSLTHQPTPPPSRQPMPPPGRVPASPSAGDPIGVPTCDAYLNKFSACIEDKIPVAQRRLMRRSLVTMREAWRKAAAAEASRQALSRACETATAAARKSLAAFNCQW